MIPDKIIRFIRQQTKGADGIVVGLSGGVDSSTVAALCVQAVGKEKVFGMVMPERGVSKRQDVADAQQLAAQLGIKTKITPINNILDSVCGVMPSLRTNKLALGNLKARIRMILLYAAANMNNYRVAGTGNKSELMTGYFTKYGDGGVDFLPIGDLTKGEVRKLAAELGVPRQIIDKVPTAGLWKGQTDENELGITYDLLDRIVAGDVKGIPRDVSRRVRELKARSDHKRRMAMVCR
ncbi:MAG TPA: NAD+ synthase [Candidatus Nanoarchaeia archaeon]|nr:NAD+ synthase [Candidatus Nanoarchaeia archaeon]